MASLEGVRVLVVDDEPDFLEMTTDMLEGHGLLVRTALDPEQALGALEAEPADVALVDLQMPKGGGRRLLRDARTRYPDLYGIVVTAYGSEKIAVELLQELGAFDYLAKTDFGEASAVAAIGRAVLARRADALIARRELEVTTDSVDGVHVISPLGYLTAEPRFERLGLLAAAVDAAREKGERAVLLDLRHVTAAVPHAFGLLLVAARRLERAGGKVAVCSAGHAVARTLELFDRATHGERGLRVLADRVAALAEVRAGTNPAAKVQ